MMKNGELCILKLVRTEELLECMPLLINLYFFSYHNLSSRIYQTLT